MTLIRLCKLPATAHVAGSSANKHVIRPGKQRSMARRKEKRRGEKIEKKSKGAGNAALQLVTERV